MATVTDEYMKEEIAKAKNYSIVIVRKGPAYKMPEMFPVLWEHARRNFSLKLEGILPVVCPGNDDSDFAGIAVFITGEDETRTIMDEDPAIKAGVLTYELHVARSFPGSSLPC
jgi:hypothetical protein